MAGRSRLLIAASALAVSTGCSGPATEPVTRAPAVGNYRTDEFDNPEHRIDKIGVLVATRPAG